LNSASSYEYNLTFSSPTARVSAESAFGVVYALESFVQLTQERSSAVHIHDWPAKKHRGLLVDVARHFLPLGLLRRTIAAMAVTKLNVLHLHLTDSQSFPVLLDSAPELAMKGAFSAKQTYTPTQLKRLVQFAKFFGVRVVPEIDVPAHTMSWGRAYPDLLINCSTVSREAATPTDVPALDPTADATYDLIEKVLAEIARIFPDDRMHLGLDEMRFKCWTERLEGDPRQHFAVFVRRLLEIVRGKLRKHPVVWQEALEASTLTGEATVQTWKCWNRLHEQAALAAIKRRLSVVDASCWYLDWPSTTTQFATKQMLPRWPLFDGGEAAMWTEHVDHSNFECRVWPRAAIVAQTLWSGTSRGKGPPPRLLSRIDARAAETPNSYCPQLNQFQSPRKPPTPPEIIDVLLRESSEPLAAFPDSSRTVVFAFVDRSDEAWRLTAKSTARNHGTTTFQARASTAGYPFTTHLAAEKLFVAAVAPIVVVAPGLLHCAGVRLDFSKRFDDPLVLTLVPRGAPSSTPFGNVSAGESGPTRARISWAPDPAT